MTSQSTTWKDIQSEDTGTISNGDLAHAYSVINNAINTLKDIGADSRQIEGLAEWSNKISKIQSDRQAAKRPEGWLMMCDMDDGSITYDTIGGRWTAGPNEQTAELRKQLEAVYETTTMVK